MSIDLISQARKRGRRGGALVSAWDDGAAARLRQAVKGAGGVDLVAKRAGLSRSGLYGLMAEDERHRVKPSETTLAQLSEVLNVPTQHFTPDTLRTTNNARRADLQLVPIDDAFASAGDGAEGVDQGVVDYVGFPRQWLRALFGDTEAVRMLTVRGDSMSPLVPDGALIMYDPKRVDAGDGIYVVRFDDHLMAKRLQHGPGGKITVASDNPHYSSHTVSADQVKKIGRVIWVASPL